MKSKQRYPGRHLNEKAFFLGLGIEDAIWLGFLFLFFWIISLVLNVESFRWVSMVLVGFCMVLLVPIRLTFRRHILRDLGRFIVKSRRLK